MERINGMTEKQWKIIKSDLQYKLDTTKRSVEHLSQLEQTLSTQLIEKALEYANYNSHWSASTAGLILEISLESLDTAVEMVDISVEEGDIAKAQRWLNTKKDYVQLINDIRTVIKENK